MQKWLLLAGIFIFSGSPYVEASKKSKKVSKRMPVEADREWKVVYSQHPFEYNRESSSIVMNHGEPCPISGTQLHFITITNNSEYPIVLQGNKVIHGNFIDKDAIEKYRLLIASKSGTRAYFENLFLSCGYNQQTSSMHDKAFVDGFMQLFDNCASWLEVPWIILWANDSVTFSLLVFGKYTIKLTDLALEPLKPVDSIILELV